MPLVMRCWPVSTDGYALVWLRTDAPRRCQWSLGYEPYDARLHCLEQSLAAALTSADGRRASMPGTLSLPRLNASRRVSCTNQPSAQLVPVASMTA